MSYDVGDLVTIGNYSGNPATTAFTVRSGTATNPTAVELTVQQPDGTVLTYGWPTPGAAGTLTNESAGRFYADVPITLSGVWHWRLVGTGAVQAADEGAFYVA